MDLTDDKSTLVQVMAWCRQATSHYLSQCWPRSMTLYGITRPQWVNSFYGRKSFGLEDREHVSVSIQAPSGHDTPSCARDHFDGWVQERRNPSALAIELHLYCINPSIFAIWREPHLELYILRSRHYKMCSVQQFLSIDIWKQGSYDAYDSMTSKFHKRE